MVKSRKKKKRGTLKQWRWVPLVILMLAGLDYFAYPWWSGVGGQSFNHATNATWLSPRWYYGQRTDLQVRQLGERLTHQQMNEAYFHVRYIKGNGKLYLHYARASHHMIDTLHAAAPEVKAIAWVYAGNKEGAGAVDLGNAQVRQAMVSEARWLVKDAGFDGVQWDYEICGDGDAGLLALLAETRAALPADKTISIAAPMWLPHPFLKWGWSDAYFGQVATYCDEIVVMCYDSAAISPRSYVWLVRQQAIHITNAVSQGNPACRVLFGVPTYVHGGISHNPQAENLQLALKGVREGLANSSAHPNSCAGVALFADYTTTDADWAIYRKYWLNR